MAGRAGDGHPHIVVMPLRILLSTVAALCSASLLRRFAYHSGATRAEVTGALPGDDVIAHPAAEWTRAATIAAPPEAIWPWLVQMGYDRGGWYTNERLDRLVWQVSATSADTLRPDLQQLHIGDVIADGPEHAAYFHVRSLEPERAIVYYSLRHPYRGHPLADTRPATLETMEGRLRDGGRYLEFSWAFVLDPIDAEHTRLIIRTRADYEPAALGLFEVPLGWVDLYHAHTMLGGIRRRVEREPQKTRVAG